MEQLSELKLNGFREALEDQLKNAQYGDMPFEERLSYLVSTEITNRRNKRIKQLLSHSKLKYKQAMIEDIDYSPQRQIDKSSLLSLSQNEWINQSQNILITGATGTGKTYLACALANRAIEHGNSVFYIRLAKLLMEISLARVDGSYLRYIAKLTRFKVLIIDDFGVAPMKAKDTEELLEVVEDRIDKGSVIITSQLAVDMWFTYLKNPTAADAVMDRLIHNSYRIEINGDSMRRLKKPSEYGGKSA
jgi:DNA replication protein DnaC